jgi:hypothetical protein
MVEAKAASVLDAQEKHRGPLASAGSRMLRVSA